MAIVAKYFLNGNANDSAGTNNGSASNITYVDGKLNQAASFNGSSSQITGITNAGYTGTSDTRAISVWIKISSLPGNNQLRYIYSATENVTSSDFQLILFNNSGTQGYYYGRGRVNFVYASFAAYTTPLDVWVNLVAIQNSSDNYLYANGLLLASNTVTGNGFGASNLGIIGKDPGVQTQYWNGLIDEVEIYNTQPLAAEIKNKYIEGLGFFTYG